MSGYIFCFKTFWTRCLLRRKNVDKCKDLLPEQAEFRGGIVCLKHKSCAIPRLLYCKSCTKFDTQFFWKLLHLQCISALTDFLWCWDCCRSLWDHSRSWKHTRCFTFSAVSEIHDPQDTAFYFLEDSVSYPTCLYVTSKRKTTTTRFCERISH